jgi:hypothetical protein
MVLVVVLVAVLVVLLSAVLVVLLSVVLMVLLLMVLVVQKKVDLLLYYLAPRFLVQKKVKTPTKS